MGIKVKLLKRKISKGRFSLYLDYYPGYTDFKTGKFIRRKFLKMYVFEEPKSHQKTHNKNMLNLAQLIYQKEENRVNRPEIYSDFEKEQIKRQEIGEQNFLEYYEKQSKKRKGDTRRSWNVSKSFFIKFINSDTSLSKTLPLS